MTPPIILASASPRRAELLERLGLDFEVRPANVEETHSPGETPEQYACRLASEKADAVARTHPDALVIGSDTIVVLGDQILEKPASADHAISMLAQLAGREHTVITAVAVSRDGTTRVVAEKVRVWFRSLDDQTIRDYVATGEPMDKAGAYGIQAFGSAIVDHIDGDYFAVMGLPIGRLIDLLAGAGYRYAFKQGLVPLT